MKKKIPNRIKEFPKRLQTQISEEDYNKLKNYAISKEWPIAFTARRLIIEHLKYIEEKTEKEKN